MFLLESAGLMRIFTGKGAAGEKCRRFCGAGKILGGPAGCLARALLINASHSGLGGLCGLRDFYPRMTRIFTDLIFFSTLIFTDFRDRQDGE